MVWQWLLASCSGYVINRASDIAALLMAVVTLALTLTLTLTIILILILCLTLGSLIGQCH